MAATAAAPRRAPRRSASVTSPPIRVAGTCVELAAVASRSVEVHGRGVRRGQRRGRRRAPRTARVPSSDARPPRAGRRRCRRRARAARCRSAGRPRTRRPVVAARPACRWHRPTPASPTEPSAMSGSSRAQASLVAGAQQRLGGDEVASRGDGASDRPSCSSTTAVSAKPYPAPPYSSGIAERRRHRPARTAATTASRRSHEARRRRAPRRVAVLGEQRHPASTASSCCSSVRRRSVTIGLPGERVEDPSAVERRRCPTPQRGRAP